MQSLPCPRHSMRFYKTEPEDLVKSELIKSFPIHAVHVVLPDLSAEKDDIIAALTGDCSTYFIAHNVPVSALVEPNFVIKFVNKGSLWAISKDCHAEYENFITIVPHGNLFMSLETEVAKSLSLVKERPLIKKKGTESFQTIKIKMQSMDFYPGKKNYDANLTELKKLDYLKFNLLIKWRPEGNICPESLRKYFVTQGFECTTCEASYAHRSTSSVPMPNIDVSELDEYGAEDMLEWIGAQICGIPYTDKNDGYISKFTAPEPSLTIHQLSVDSFEGFHSSDQIARVIRDLQNKLRESSSAPFVGLVVTAFQDCYLVRKDFGKFCSLDKMVAIFLTRKGKASVVTLNLE